MKRIRVIMVWIVGISFIAIGFFKYLSLEEEVKSVFERANFPTWLYFAVGTIEWIAGVLLLMTAATSKRWGSIMIGLIMLGAIATRFLLNEPPQRLILPGVILLISILISFDFEIKKKST